MKFCTVINCMDGRVQLPVISYMQERFKANYVDSITEPGPNLILAEKSNQTLVKSIISRVKISVEKHKSAGIAVVGHYDCSGNPSTKEEQLVQTEKAVELVSQYFDIPVIALWVDKNWQVDEI